MQLVKSAVALVLFSAGLGFVTVGLAADSASKNAAIVNGVPIPQARVDFVAESQISQSQGQQEDNREFRDNIREVLITREILWQEAIKRKLDKNPDYITQLDLAKQQIILAVLLEDVNKSIKPTAADVRKEYDRVKTESGGDAGREFKARHILVKDEAEAKQIIADLAKGADFAKLAAEKSTDPGSREDGGQLDWAEAQAYVQPFGEALLALKKGETTQTPVQTNFGYHVIELQDVRTRPFPEFEQVQAQIEKQLADKARDDFITELRAKAKIEKIDPK